MMFDFKHPIRGTRDEVILIKFSGCIKNIGEMMYRAALSTDKFRSYWLERYSRFIALDGKNDEEIFNTLSAFTGAEFLRCMTISQNEYQKRGMKENLRDYAELMSLINPYDAAVTNIELMLKEMLTYPFLKKLYIYDVTFSDITKKYLREVYAQNGSKITLLDGKLYDILDSKPEITTVFSDDVGDVTEVIQSEPEGSDKWNKKLFMISAIPSIIDPTSATEMFQNQKFLSETRERFKCETAWFQLKFITKFVNNRYTVSKKGNEENG